MGRHGHPHRPSQERRQCLRGGGERQLHDRLGVVQAEWVSDMRLDHDRRADAVYVTLLRDIAWDHQVRLDPRRIVDYGIDGRVIGIELLGVHLGVDVDGLPDATSLAKELGKLGIPVLHVA